MRHHQHTQFEWETGNGSHVITDTSRVPVLKLLIPGNCYINVCENTDAAASVESR